ncbi:MAG TPA: hypothetical protein VMT27_09840 [Actinomycetes bacterium]|nr:hypothetical protein [Actinomycetes bacterium]
METRQTLLEVRSGEGPWRVAYQDGVVVAIDVWETDDKDNPTAHHRLVKSRSGIVPRRDT